MNNFGMTDSKYSKFLTILLIVVIIAILILLGFWGYSEYKKYTTNIETDAMLEQWEKDVKKNNTITNEDTSDPYQNVAPPDFSNMVTTVSNANTATTKQTYKGFVMVGRIEIPKTSVNLPILEEVTKKSIETAVAVLYSTGQGLNTPGNTTIVGHNYRNGLFFSNNAKIAIGDKIYITDLTGNKVTYTVYNTYITTPEDAEYMTRDTAGAMEISLSTCTDDSSGRIIIWARAD